LSIEAKHRVAAILLLGVVVAAGCRADMQDQPRYEPNGASHFFDDGRADRPLVAGVVAHGSFHDDSPFFEGKRDGAFVAELPMPLTQPLLARGRERFDIYCSPCHSRVGDGDGMIVKRGYRRPPSFHIPRLREAANGYFFDVISHGFGVMPSYAAQIPTADRWAIVAYLRALQLSQYAPLSDVALSDRERLDAPQAPTPGGSAAPTHGGKTSGGAER
jgi:cbb3-type cytochrome c oxidase subunit III